MLRTFAVFVLASASLLAQTDPKCTPTDTKQERGTLKNRDATSDTPQTVTVQQILKFGFPQNIDTDPSLRLSEKTIDGHESTTYTMTVKLWRVGRQANDCEYHAEVGAANSTKSSPRVIIEIKKDDPATRKAFLNVLPADIRQNFEQLTDDQNDHHYDLDGSVKVTVVGLAYFDAPHYIKNWQATPHCSAGNAHCDTRTPKQRRQRGNHHGSASVGTIWELHPIWEIKP